MKYNANYDRWVSKDGLVYRYSKTKDKLVLCKAHLSGSGYLSITIGKGKKYIHRIVWETFKGPIPDGYEIDHIEGNKTDNRLEMLRCVTHKENMNNKNTLQKNHDNHIGKTYSDFGNKFKEHFGITRLDNLTLYNTEKSWYYNHNNKCRWEV